MRNLISEDTKMERIIELHKVLDAALLSHQNLIDNETYQKMRRNVENNAADLDDSQYDTLVATLRLIPMIQGDDIGW